MSSSTIAKADFIAERPKHQDSVLPYVIDWSDWLDSGETLTDFEVETVELAGISLVDAGSLINGATAIKFVIGGGTSGETALLSIKGEVDANKVDYRTLAIEIK